VNPVAVHARFSCREAGTTLQEREVSAMRIFRALIGSVLWLLAGILGLVGVILCATLILLPLGIPVLMLARKLFAYSMVFFVPRKVRHPVQELGKSARGGAADAVDSVKKTKKKTKKNTPDVDLSPVSKRAGKMSKKGRSFLKRQRKRVA
jgi:hypothetical protein